MCICDQLIRLLYFGQLDTNIAMLTDSVFIYVVVTITRNITVSLSPTSLPYIDPTCKETTVLVLVHVTWLARDGLLCSLT